MITAMKPMERLTHNEVRFLIKSGSFTAHELTETSASVDKCARQVFETI